MKKMKNYEGELDEQYRRTGRGEEFYRRLEGNQYYKGNFTNDTYNGYGFYKSDGIFNEKWAYEGSFFSNAKEGYGLLSLGNNSYFQGLFKADHPFGPGVLTRESGEQDVGFWQGSSIIRLIRPVECDLNELSTTEANKVSVIKFRKLIEIVPDENTAFEIAKDANVPEKAPELYSIYGKNPRSKLFNRDQFEEKYLEDTRKMVDLCLASLEYFKEEDENEFLTEEEGNLVDLAEEILLNGNLAWDKIRKKENLLLAWNNSPLIVKIMIHTFFHQLFENLAGFGVLSLLCNKRKHFKEPGPLERATVDLLESTSRGDMKRFTRTLADYNLNINVQDNKGNGCVIRAASRDNHSLLYLLFIFGANMNIINDEGFTALNHTIARYLALKKNVSNWGEGFMPPTSKGSPGPKWRRCSANIERDSVKSGKIQMPPGYKKSFENNKNARNQGGTEYVFHLGPALKRKPQRTKSVFRNKKSPKRSSKSSVKSRSAKRKRRSGSKNSEATINENENREKSRIEIVYETIKLLLSFKADPNMSIVPQPAIIQAVFSEELNLVKILLEAGANPNARFLREEGHLTALHALCLAKPHTSFPSIMDTLLEYGADPNAQGSADYDQATQSFLLHGKSDDIFPRVGIKPLQSLLLRSDASYIDEKKILQDLLQKLHDITDKEPKYFGHSFLSLAMVRMNLPFIHTLLHVFGADPNEDLGPEWGNIGAVYLTFLGRKKDREAIITLFVLEAAGMNPLRIVKMGQTCKEENLINFALKMFKRRKRGRRSRGFSGASLGRKSPSRGPEPRGAKKSQDSTRMSKGSLRKSVGSFRKTSAASKKSDVSLEKSEGTRKSDASSGQAREGSKEALQGLRKQLIMKSTLLQSFGRDKVDRYIQGVVLRRFLKYVREAERNNLPIDPSDARAQQMINWYRTEDDFVKILTSNVLAGNTFLSRNDVQLVYNMMPWDDVDTNVYQKRKTVHKDSLNQADKAYLEEMKFTIRNQLAAGNAPDRIVFPRKKRSGSSASRHQSPKSDSFKKSEIWQPQEKKSQTKPYLLKSTDFDNRNSKYSTPTYNKKINIMDDVRTSVETTQSKEDEFQQKLSAMVIISAPYVRWANRSGYGSVKMIKRETFSTDLFPEVDKIAYLYKVCYRCVKRDTNLELCPMCRLVYYCSSDCNIWDVINIKSNHQCKADFYGREDQWRHYGFDEGGYIFRKPRAGQEYWETDDILRDILLKKYGRPELEKSTRRGNRQISLAMGDGKGKRHREGSQYTKYSPSPTKSTRSKRQKSMHRNTMTSIGRRGSGKYGSPTGKFSKGRKASGRSHRASSISRRASGKSRRASGKSHRALGKGRRASGKSRKASGKTGRASGKYGSKWKQKGGKLGNTMSMKQMKKLMLRRQKNEQMREMREKWPKGIMGDYMRWGHMKKPTAQSLPWYQKQKELNPGNLKDPAGGQWGTLLAGQMKVLQGLAEVLGPNFNLNNWFPWVVVRNGELYYKVNSTLFVLENYSLN